MKKGSTIRRVGLARSAHSGKAETVTPHSNEEAEQTGDEAEYKSMKARNQEWPEKAGKDEDPSMKNTVLLWTIILAFILFSYSQAYLAAADTDNRRDTVEEEIWALEEAYFANLYKANYEGVLAIVHSQFLGWPGAVPQPIDREGGSRADEVACGRSETLLPARGGSSGGWTDTEELAQLFGAW